MPRQLHGLARNSAQEFGSNLISECNLKIAISLTRDFFIRAAPPKEFRLQIEQTSPDLSLNLAFLVLLTLALPNHPRQPTE